MKNSNTRLRASSRFTEFGGTFTALSVNDIFTRSTRLTRTSVFLSLGVPGRKQRSLQVVSFGIAMWSCDISTGYVYLLDFTALVCIIHNGTMSALKHPQALVLDIFVQLQLVTITTCLCNLLRLYIHRKVSFLIRLWGKLIHTEYTRFVYHKSLLDPLTTLHGNRKTNY